MNNKKKTIVPTYPLLTHWLLSICHLFRIFAPKYVPIMIKPDYPSVLLIYTGGTIGMIENPATGALEAFNFDRWKPSISTSFKRTYRN